MKEHDFKKFPELANSQIDLFYFESPHKQILEDFRAKVIKVVDGDTVRLEWDERDFDFPLRLLNIQAPELGEDGGDEARKWLEGKLLGEEVDILIDKSNRVEKWGRLLGTIMFNGMDIAEEEINLGLATSWDRRNENKIPTLDELLN